MLFMGGCAVYAGNQWDKTYGPTEPRDRMVAADTQAGSFYLNEVQPIIENRCVVCHGCYDAPCQLNLSAPQGIDRGASKVKVYNSSRLTAAPLTRLLEDAQTTQQWREMDFFPVLNEHEQTPEANLNA
ncbi:MAG: fatty acid cis/trans isomerase, partial [Xanthomonadales bacterium]|nr:fatty acid cis/trans isomerase [Xanthomonadales bacterium]